MAGRPAYEETITIPGLERFRVREEVVERSEEEQQALLDATLHAMGLQVVSPKDEAIIRKVEEAVDLKSAHVEIDYDKQCVNLVNHGVIIQSSPIDDLLVRRSSMTEEELLMELTEREDLVDYVALHKPVGYRCMCHYTKIDRKTKALRNVSICSICGTVVNIPYYDKE